MILQRLTHAETPVAEFIRTCREVVGADHGADPGVAQIVKETLLIKSTLLGQAGYDVGVQDVGRPAMEYLDAWPHRGDGAIGLCFPLSQPVAVAWPVLGGLMQPLQR